MLATANREVAIAYFQSNGAIDKYSDPNINFMTNSGKIKQPDTIISESIIT